MSRGLELPRCQRPGLCRFPPRMTKSRCSSSQGMMSRLSRGGGGGGGGGEGAPNSKEKGGRKRGKKLAHSRTRKLLDGTSRARAATAELLSLPDAAICPLFSDRSPSTREHVQTAGLQQQADRDRTRPSGGSR